MPSVSQQLRHASRSTITRATRTHQRAQSQMPSAGAQQHAPPHTAPGAALGGCSVWRTRHRPVQSRRRKLGTQAVRGARYCCRPAAAAASAAGGVARRVSWRSRAVRPAAAPSRRRQGTTSPDRRVARPAGPSVRPSL